MQFALPPVVLALGTALLVIGIAATLALAYYVYRDASLRGSERPAAWAAGAVLPMVGVLVLVLYLLTRDSIGVRTEPRSRLESVCLSLYPGLVGAFVLGSLLSPPDPFSVLLYLVPALAVTIPAAYLVLDGVSGPGFGTA